MNSIKLVWTCVLTLLLSSIFSLAQSSFDNYLSIQLFHSLDAHDPKGFTSRGNISVVSINSADFIVNQKELSLKERDTLQKLAKDKKFYRLKADIVSSDGIKRTFLSSVKACHLIASQLHDFITINFDHNNAVLGINEKTVNLDGTTDDCESLSLGNVNEFSTVVNLKNIESAPQADTLSFIQKLEREKNMREKGEIDNRSFLQKYWVYIVPAIILLLISGVTNPETQAAAGR